MTNEKNSASAANIWFPSPGGRSGRNIEWTAVPTPTSSTMARWLKNTNSAAVKISLRSLTCWDRKNRKSVDADSASVSSAVGTQPIARSSALTDSPQNRPDCLVAINPQGDPEGAASTAAPCGASKPPGPALLDCRATAERSRDRYS